MTIKTELKFAFDLNRDLSRDRFAIGFFRENRTIAGLDPIRQPFSDRRKFSICIFQLQSAMLMTPPVSFNHPEPLTQ